MTTTRRARMPKITARKYMGNDEASWAIFVDRTPVLTGLYRREVSYYREQVRQRYAPKVK